jgi:hypothetical protein
MDDHHFGYITIFIKKNILNIPQNVCPLQSTQLTTVNPTQLTTCISG